MKLLRLTTDLPDGTFDARFNEDIIIPANSSIALQSCALNTDQSELTINGVNSDVSYIINGNAETMNLEHNVYNENNFHILLNDLTTKFNQGLNENEARELCTEWRVFHNLDNKIHIELKNTSYHMPNPIAISEQFDEENAGSMNIVNANSGSISNGGGQVADDSVRLNSIHEFTNGCGAFYCKLKGMNNVNGNVLKLILTKKNPDQLGNNIDDADIEYGISINCDGTGAITTQRYTYIEKGVSTLSGIAISDSGAGITGDIFGLESSGTRMRAVIYRNGQAVQDTIMEAPIDVNPNTLSKDTYYAAIIMRGASTDAKICQVKFSATPYQTPTRALTLHNDLGYLDHNIEVRPTQPTTNRINVSVIFNERTLPTYLGFRNLRQDQLNNNDFNFKGDDIFRPQVENDCFIVVLETMRLESFDALVQGRKSILCSIPNDNHNEIVMYEPNTLIPVKLSNAKEISIRNLRLRLFYQDYSEVLLSGLSVITLLIM